MNNESKTIDMDTLTHVDIERNAALIELLDAYTINGSSVGRYVVDGNECEVRFIVVTPDLASEILEKYNNENRPLSKTNVIKLAKEMENGNWKFNGETLSFNAKGNLSNGQHRLHGIVVSGMTFRFLVTSGIDPETFPTIDSGRKRTGSDVLGIAGVSNATTASAVCKFINAFKTGKFSYTSKASDNRTLSNTDIEEYYNSLKNIDESIKFGKNMSLKSCGLLTATVVSSFHYLFSEVDDVLAEDFLTKLSTGIDLKQNSPILALRNRLLNSKNNESFRLTNDAILKLICYAWEKFVKNEIVKVLKLPENYEINIYGSNPQKMLDL
jgi:hypothetical protein